jgi:beta-glucanase (GH16 family)
MTRSLATVGLLSIGIGALAVACSEGDFEPNGSEGQELRKCGSPRRPCDAGIDAPAMEDAGAASDSGASGATDGAASDAAASGEGAPAPPPPPAPGKIWQLVFAEEFNGTGYDPTKLTPCFDWNFGDCTASFNQGRERYLPGQVRVGDGTARLVAEPLSPPYASDACYQGQCTYKAGLLSTARPSAANGSSYLFPFTYGYLESRMKFPAVKGLFTAFWMLPTDPTYDYRSEIDIVEILGYDPTTIWMHYHYADRSSSYRVNSGVGDNGACPVKDYSKDFVRFGIDWEPTHLAWYIDGIKCGQYDGSLATVESGPMQLILHMMVDNSWERSWGQTLDSLTTVGSRSTTSASTSRSRLSACSHGAVRLRHSGLMWRIPFASSR